MKAIQALILDMDGVFVDTEPLHFEAFRRVFRQLGVRLSDPYLFKLVGDPVARNLSDIKRDFKTDFDEQEVTGLLERSYFELVHECDFGARPGIWPLIHRARRQRWQLGLCTSSNREQAQFLIERVSRHDGEAPGFDAVVALEDVELTKPDPDPYHRLCRALELPPPQALAIEDSRSGILSAKRAGCHCYGLRTFYNRQQDFKSADRILSDLHSVFDP